MGKRTLGTWLRAYGFFAGGVIGVGIFGLPAALQAAGWPLFLLQLAIVAPLAWWIQRCFLVVVRATPGRHRVPGYARALLPRFAARAAGIANVLGLTGALIAYLLAGGAFLHLLLAPYVTLSLAGATALYLFPAALLLLRGLRALPSLELIILGMFLLVLAGLPLAARDAFVLQNLTTAGSWAAAFVPYGVLLFSFWGVSLVPEVFELTARNERRAGSVLAASLVTAVAASLLFAVLVAGISGAATTEDALTGLQRTLGDGVVKLTLLFGMFTTFSSYLALGLALLRTLQVDFRVRRARAWALTIFVPVGLIVLGVQSLLAVLSLTGAVLLGVEGLAVLAMRWRLRQPQPRRGTRWALAVSAVLLVAGVVSELVRNLVG